MKKILNRPVDYVDEMLDGLCAAHPDIYAQPSPRVIARANGATAGKVGIVTGGGSGHCRSSPAMSAGVCSTPAPSASLREPVGGADGGGHAGRERWRRVLRLYGNSGGE